MKNKGVEEEKKEASVQKNKQLSDPIVKQKVEEKKGKLSIFKLFGSVICNKDCLIAFNLGLILTLLFNVCRD